MVDPSSGATIARVAEAEVVDVDRAVAADMFRYMGGWATKIRGSTISLSLPGEYHSYTLREPVGVVGQIIPWNFPLLMAAWKLGPALATGCTVVLKVAEQTPLSALRLGQLIQEAGFPDGAVNILSGFGETAGAANAIFFNHGQCCCAGSMLYAHQAVFDEVVAGVSAAAQAIRLGRDIAKAHRMAARLRTSTVWLNCHNVLDAALPFGGYKESGWGREMGEFALENHLEVKAVTAALA